MLNEQPEGSTAFADAFAEAGGDALEMRLRSLISLAVKQARTRETAEATIAAIILRDRQLLPAVARALMEWAGVEVPVCRAMQPQETIVEPHLSRPVRRRLSREQELAQAKEREPAVARAHEMAKYFMSDGREVALIHAREIGAYERGGMYDTIFMRVARRFLPALYDPNRTLGELLTALQLKECHAAAVKERDACGK